MNNSEQLIIPYYSPISAKGGRRIRRNTKRHKKTRHNRRTRRRYN